MKSIKKPPKVNTNTKSKSPANRYSILDSDAQSVESSDVSQSVESSDVSQSVDSSYEASSSREMLNFLSAEKLKSSSPSSSSSSSPLSSSSSPLPSSSSQPYSAYSSTYRRQSPYKSLRSAKFIKDCRLSQIVDTDGIQMYEPLWCNSFQFIDTDKKSKFYAIKSRRRDDYKNICDISDKFDKSVQELLFNVLTSFIKLDPDYIALDSLIILIEDYLINVQECIYQRDEFTFNFIPENERDAGHKKYVDISVQLRDKYVEWHKKLSEMKCEPYWGGKNTEKKTCNEKWNTEISIKPEMYVKILKTMRNKKNS